MDNVSSFRKTNYDQIINPVFFHNCINMSSESQTTAPSQCVGPEYRPTTQKPTATVSTPLKQENVHILPQTPQLIALLT